MTPAGGMGEAIERYQEHLERRWEWMEQYDPEQAFSQPPSQDDQEFESDEVETADALEQSMRDPESRGTFIADHPNVNPWGHCD